MREAYRGLSEILLSLKPYSMDLTLDRVRECLKKLGNPETAFSTVVVGGTNGKGTVVQMLTDAFVSAGFKVGTYISPHLVHLNERVRVDNRPLSYELLFSLSQILDGCSFLTYFEFLTVLSFVAFKELGVDVAVLEVGMGGEFDATNTTKPLLSVITSVSFDHTEHLGRTLREIARTKSKIIRRLGVVGKNCDEVKNEIGKSVPDARLFFVDDRYVERAYSKKTLMVGDAFRDNLAVALLAVDVLNSEYSFGLNSDVMYNTYWPARVEIIDSKPVFIIDGAHNISAFANLKRFYSGVLGDKTLVFSSLRTKNWKGILHMVKNDFVSVKLPRLKHRLSVEPERIRSYLVGDGYGGSIALFDSVNDALFSCFDSGNTCIVAGSLYLAGEAKACVIGEDFLP